MKKRVLLILLVFAMLIPMLASCDEMQAPTVSDTMINEQGELIVIFSDGTTKNAGKVPKADPITVDKTEIDENGDVIITFSDEFTKNAGKAPATPAPTVESAEIDENGDVIIKFSDGSQTNAGKAPATPAPTVESVEIDENGDLIIRFSDGTQQIIPNSNGGTGNEGEALFDMNGYVYKVFTRSDTVTNAAFKCEDFYVDPATGGADALSIAVIERNQAIEQDYNCVIKQQSAVLDSQYDEMTSFFDSDTTFEATVIRAIDAATCATSGFLSNLKSDINAPYLDLTNEAFDQSSIRDLSVGNSLYFLSGDMNISTMDNTVSTIFNLSLFYQSKEAIADKLGHNNFDDPHQMVKDGTWTIENMLAIANCVTVDARDDDGDISHDKGDTIGYYEYQASPLYYYYGAGLRITESEDSSHVFTITSEAAENMYEYLFQNLNLNLNKNIANGASGNRIRNFCQGNTLFADFLLWDIRKAIYPATIDFAYGMLPIPTYEENADYHHVVHFQNCAHLWAIPYKRANVEYSSRMLEIMATYSTDSTMNAYYVKTMYMEVARDDGSRATLDIIRGSLVYDIALLYSFNGLWGNFDKLLMNIDTKANIEYYSYTSESAMENANMEMQATLADFAAMSE